MSNYRSPILTTALSYFAREKGKLTIAILGVSVETMLAYIVIGCRYILPSRLRTYRFEYAVLKRRLGAHNPRIEGGLQAVIKKV